jgi:Family of unknown function (DUF6338)
MIPSSVPALFGFLFLVAPGVAYEIHRERRRPALQQSTFREASRVALWSLVFTTAAVAVLALARFALPRLLPDPSAWLAEKGYAKQHGGAVGTFIVLEVTLAQVMAWGTAAVVGRHDRSRIRQGDIWHKVFAADVPRNREVQAVILTDNAEYRGTIVGYTVNADVSNRELELQHVTFRMRRGGEEARWLPEPFDRVVIASTAIQEMWLHYRNEIEPGPSWWRRMMAWRERGRTMSALQKATRRAQGNKPRGNSAGSQRLEWSDAHTSDRDRPQTRQSAHQDDGLSGR